MKSTRFRKCHILVCVIVGLGTIHGLAKPCCGQEVVKPHHLVGHEEAPLLRRVQDVIDDWDPRKLVNPLVVTSESTVSEKGADDKVVTKIVVRKQLRRPDLAQFVADVEAVEALGKALFWEMQAGSDFRKTKEGVMVGTACASCHYRHGADARNRYTTRLPWVAWDKYKLHNKHPLEFGQLQEPFSAAAKATKEVPFQSLQPAGPFSLIVGSQGVESFVFQGFKDQGDDAAGMWKEELFKRRSLQGYKYLPEWAMFIDADYVAQPDGAFKVTERSRFRQITNRNSPTTINAGFSNRLFHDGRAESTFNGFSIFGDADPREVIHRRRVSQTLDASGKVLKESVDIVPVKVAITSAALASQAVGPIVNDIEMSYLGRQFPHVAYKLLDARILGFQEVDPTDSVLHDLSVGKKGALTYRQLIQKAFRREWWDDSGLTKPEKTPLVLLRDCDENADPRGSLMEANFSLYWGLAIMFYEASLVSNQSPFDDMLRGRTEKVEAKWNAVKSGSGPDDQLQPIRRDQRSPQPPPEHVSGAAVFQHGFRVFLNRGCVDCHAGPLMSEVSVRLPEVEKFPIHQEIERSLLPNSRADALLINVRRDHENLLQTLAAVVTKHFPKAADRVEKIAIELDRIRDAAQGERKILFARVLKYLEAAFPTVAGVPRRAAANELANRLFNFEKLQPTLFGNRTFFSEDERVAMAELIADPVLIEKMPIPADQVPARPRLPIQGPLANEHYAFYDLGFYALGVSPPRYDRGIGDKKASPQPLDVALIKAVASLTHSEESSDQETAHIVGEALQNAATPRQVLEDIRGDRITLSSESKARFLEAVEEGLQAPATSSPGSAYRFSQRWHSDRYRSQQKGRAAVESAAAVDAIPDSATPTKCDLDADFRGKMIDTSWDRSDIPYGDRRKDPLLNKDEIVPGPGRRSAYYYLSRARRLVTNEEYWGHRKPFLHDNELAFWGSFRTPTLRNVELTAPYMHNGRLMTLLDVVEFYENEEPAEAGQARPQLPRNLAANPDKHPAIGDVDLNDSDKRALVFFLLCLTDDRVRREEAPFDHPEITLVNGYKEVPAGGYEDALIKISATGSMGHSSYASRFPSDQ